MLTTTEELDSFPACRASEQTGLTCFAHEAFFRGISSVGRAFGWQPKGHRFEPGILHFGVLYLFQLSCCNTTGLGSPAEARFGHQKRMHPVLKLRVLAFAGLFAASGRHLAALQHRHHLLQTLVCRRRLGSRQTPASQSRPPPRRGVRGSALRPPVLRTETRATGGSQECEKEKVLHDRPIILSAMYGTRFNRKTLSL